MLNGAHVAAAIPSQDLNRAKRFYAEKLGLTPSRETTAGLEYEMAGGTGFLLFTSSGKSAGAHTQMSFVVDDVPSTVKELQAHGLQFEEYDMPGLKTVGGVADYRGTQGAWFKDSEGNLLSISRRVRVEAGR